MKHDTKKLIQKNKCYCNKRKKVISLTKCNLKDCRIWLSCAKDSWGNYSE